MSPLVIKALKHARIDIDACIISREARGNGDICEGLRQTLALLDAALAECGASVAGLNVGEDAAPDRSAPSQERPR